MSRYQEAIDRLVESGAPDLVLRVPHRDMDLAAVAFLEACVEGRVQNMWNARGFKVGPRRRFKQRK